MKALVFSCCFSLMFSSSVLAGGVRTGENIEAFVGMAFSDTAPELNTLWLNKSLKQEVKSKLDYQFAQLRVRYWGLADKTAWVLEEVGKEKPITFGVVVEADKVKSLKVLEYRESRGGEIQHDFFTKQFANASLNGGQNKLSQKIDGITGATLSVRASKKVAKLALFLHQLTPYRSTNEQSQNE